MSQRRSLAENIRLEEQREQEFVKQSTSEGKAKRGPQSVVPISTDEEPKLLPNTTSGLPVRPYLERAPSLRVRRIAVTVRLKPEVADALKRASLERQLTGSEVHTQQQIVEQALTPWLRQEGLL